MFIDATIYSFAPLILLTLFNIAIIRYLFKAADESLKLKESQYKSSFSQLSPPLTPAFTNNRANSACTPLGSGGGQQNDGMLIQQNKINYQTLKVPKLSTGSAKFKKKPSKTFTVSYMKTYFEEGQQTRLLSPGASSNLIRSPSSITTDTCLLSTQSGHKSMSFEFQPTTNSHQQQQAQTNNTNGVAASNGGVGSVSSSSNGVVGTRSLRSNSNITVRSVSTLGGGVSGHYQPTQPFKRLNTRITVMLITLNITFCIFSMPMVILQIIYFSFYPFLEATSYYMFYTTTPTESVHPATTPFMSIVDAAFSNLTANGTEISEALVSVVSESLSSSSGGGSLNTHHTVYDIPVDEKMLAKVDLIKCIAELLQYLNHSTNFFLYSLSGKTFRNETKSFILHHLNAIKAFFRNKKFKYFLHTAAQQSSSSSSNHSINCNDPERLRLRKQLKKRLKRQNSFKYSFRTNLV